MSRTRSGSKSPGHEDILMKMALDLAGEEVKGGRNVMILLPDHAWMRVCSHTSLSKISITRAKGRGDLHIRFASRHNGLRSVLIDTLILVEPDTPSWDADGETLARERLVTSTNPQVAQVGGKV